MNREKKKTNKKTRYKIYSKLTIKTLEHANGVVLVSLLLIMEHTSHLVLVFLFSTLSR